MSSFLIKEVDRMEKRLERLVKLCWSKKPLVPARGDEWFDTNQNQWMVYNGYEWIADK